MQNSNAKITWDEDDQERTILTHKKFTKDDLKQMDFKAYLASSSDSDHSTDDEAVMKYRSLLTDLNNDSENEENEEGKDLEITFQPGLSARVSQLLDKKKEREVIYN